MIQDSIAEFNLITNQFAAEYGHSAGGQFNIITKSGGNSYHGSLFGYNQNRNYNAMDNLDKVAGLTEPSRFDYNRVWRRKSADQSSTTILHLWFISASVGGFGNLGSRRNRRQRPTVLHS